MRKNFTNRQDQMIDRFNFHQELLTLVRATLPINRRTVHSVIGEAGIVCEAWGLFSGIYLFDALYASQLISAAQHRSHK